jgi:hypothetical protein
LKVSRVVVVTNNENILRQTETLVIERIERLKMHSGIGGFIFVASAAGRGGQ